MSFGGKMYTLHTAISESRVQNGFGENGGGGSPNSQPLKYMNDIASPIRLRESQ